MSEWNMTGGGGRRRAQGQGPQPPAPRWAGWQPQHRHRGRPPPDCVARLPKGAQARRVDWTKLLPPSLGVEIQAIQQVGLAPLGTPNPP